MKTVKIKRVDLLEKVKANKVRHVTEFKEAREEYVKEVIKELGRMLKKAKKGDIIRSINLVEPVSYEENYNRVISMLEWSTDVIVELDTTEFEQYVRDNWQWKQHFAATAALYNNKGM